MEDWFSVFQRSSSSSSSDSCLQPSNQSDQSELLPHNNLLAPHRCAVHGSSPRARLSAGSGARFPARPDAACPRMKLLDSPGLSSSGRCSSTAGAAAGAGSPSCLGCPRLSSAVLTLAYRRGPLAGTSRPNPSRSGLWSQLD